MPWLATSYKVSKNGKKYTLKLRKGVRFSNGKPMTAADVKFSIDDARAQDKGWGFLDVAIKNVQAPNPSTVVFNLKYRVGAVPRRSSPSSRTGSSPRTSPARSGRSSTSTRSARARSCGTSASSASR